MILHDFSWKCFRGQKSAKPALTSNFGKIDSRNSEIKTSDWLSNADDWGSDTEECIPEDIMEQGDDTGNETYNYNTDENVLNNLKGLNLSNTNQVIKPNYNNATSVQNSSRDISPNISLSSASIISGGSAIDVNANVSPNSSGKNVDIYKQTKLTDPIFVYISRYQCL